MGKFSIQDTQTGKTVTIEGDKAPTQADAEEIFQQAGLRQQSQPPQSDNILTSVAKLFAPQTTQAVTQLPGQLQQQAAAREATNPAKGNIINSVENAFGNTADLAKGTVLNPRLWAEDASYVAPIGEIAGMGSKVLSRAIPAIAGKVANIGGQVAAHAGVGGLFSAAQPDSNGANIGEAAILNSILGPLLGKGVSALSKVPLITALGLEGPQLTKLTTQAGVPAIHGNSKEISSKLGKLYPIFRDQLNTILGKDTAGIAAPKVEDIVPATAENLSNNAGQAIESADSKLNPKFIRDIIGRDKSGNPIYGEKLHANPDYKAPSANGSAKFATAGETSAPKGPGPAPLIGDILQQSGKGMTFKEAMPDFSGVSRDLTTAENKEAMAFLNNEVNDIAQKVAPKTTPYNIETDRLPLEAWDQLKAVLQNQSSWNNTGKLNGIEKISKQGSGMLNESIKDYLAKNVSKEDAKAYGDINGMMSTGGKIRGRLNNNSDFGKVTQGIGRYSPLGLALIPMLTHLGVEPMAIAGILGTIASQPRVATNIARAGDAGVTQDIISPTISKILSNMGVNLSSGQ